MTVITIIITDVIAISRWSSLDKCCSQTAAVVDAIDPEKSAASEREVTYGMNIPMLILFKKKKKKKKKEKLIETDQTNPRRNRR